MPQRSIRSPQVTLLTGKPQFLEGSEPLGTPGIQARGNGCNGCGPCSVSTAERFILRRDSIDELINQGRIEMAHSEVERLQGIEQRRYDRHERIGDVSIHTARLRPPLARN